MTLSTVMRAVAVVALVVAWLGAINAETINSGLRQHSSGRRLLGPVDQKKCDDLKFLQYDRRLNDIHWAYRWYIYRELHVEMVCNLNEIKKQLALIKKLKTEILGVVAKEKSMSCGWDLKDFTSLDTDPEFQTPPNIEKVCPPIDCKAVQKGIDSNGALIDQHTAAMKKVIAEQTCLNTQQRADFNSHIGPISGLKMSNSLSVSYNARMCSGLHDWKPKVTLPDKLPADC